MLDLKKKIESLDDYFGYLLLFAGIIIEIVLAGAFLTAHLLLFSLPLVAFMLWTVMLIYAYRAKVKFRYEYEKRFLETARAYAYFFCLAFTMSTNFLAVFYSSYLIIPFVVLGTGIGLNLILWAIVRSFFPIQMIFLEEEQRTQFKKTLDYVGRASIYYSMAVAVLDSIILLFVNLNFVPNVVSVVILAIVYMFPAYLIYDRENRSRKLAEILATSLRKTRLRQKCENRLKREERKRKEKLSKS
jgi:hypothetical protein